jgi:hypothetical protein
LNSEVSVEPSTTTELQQQLVDITEIVSCLYRLNIALRNPAPRDRFAKSSSIDTSHFEFWDIQHVSVMFPDANPQLLKRLGEANSKRRQLLKYLQGHHFKLSLNIDILQPAGIAEGAEYLVTDEKRSIAKILKPGANAAPSIVATTVDTQTTVTTFKEAEAEHLLTDDKSEVSSATAGSSSIDGRLHVPSPPKGALDGYPFQCPYCYEMITIKGTISWR